MSFADEVDAALKPKVRCKTCQILMGMPAKDRDEVQEFILGNPDKARRIALALKERGLSVGEGSVRDHSREKHALL